MRALLLLIVAGCQSKPSEVLGPFTGQSIRFAVHFLVLPQSSNDFVHDLNGDGHMDNRFGNISGLLYETGHVTNAVDAMLGSGVLAPSFEIITDDPELRSDGSVGIRFLGGAGEASALLGGRLENGHLISNDPATSRFPANANVHLPLFKDADPVVAPAVGLFVDLSFAADGSSAMGHLNGALVDGMWQMSGYASFVQSLAATSDWLGEDDKNRDGVISLAEFYGDPWVANATLPDVELFDSDGHWAPSIQNAKRDSLSFGVGLILQRCDQGNCHDPDWNQCLDRVLDGNETDVDCGGSCAPCAGGALCGLDADCQTHRCESGGRCAAPTCQDGLWNGLESDLDCGDNCPACAAGRRCRLDADCASGHCDSLECSAP